MNIKNKIRKLKNSKVDYKKYNHQLQKTKKTKLQKKKQYELNKRRALIREQNESNKEIKQNERRQKRENTIDGDIDLGKFSELASSEKTCDWFKFT